MSNRSPAAILYNTAGDAVGVDAVTKALIVVGYAHHEVHEGSHFTAQNWQAVSGDGTELDLLITVPAAVYPHMVWEFVSTVAFEFELFETSVTSADGTAENITNSNRSIGTSGSVTIHRAPTVTADGTSLLKGLVASGFKAGGASGREGELVLKPSTKYLMRFTKTDAGEGRIEYAFNWYEKS